MKNELNPFCYQLKVFFISECDVKKDIKITGKTLKIKIEFRLRLQTESCEKTVNKNIIEMIFFYHNLIGCEIFTQLLCTHNII